MIIHFAVTSLLINIHFLELPFSGDVSCVAGKININGTMTTVLRSCTDQLRVLCEPNGGDVTDGATTSSTVTAQSGNNNATKTNHKITNLGIGNQTSCINDSKYMYLYMVFLSVSYSFKTKRMWLLSHCVIRSIAIPLI